MVIRPATTEKLPVVVAVLRGRPALLEFYQCAGFERVGEKRAGNLVVMR